MHIEAPSFFSLFVFTRSTKYDYPSCLALKTIQTSRDSDTLKPTVAFTAVMAFFAISFQPSDLEQPLVQPIYTDIMPSLTLARHICPLVLPQDISQPSDSLRPTDFQPELVLME